MVFRNKALNKFWRFSSSFQLGIPILIAITILIAWGTIIESQFDATTAKKIVYDSWMMWLVMSLLVYNLVIVVLDRWPWQSRHYPFITVHAGLVILIFGGFITSQYGTDGQMVVSINGKNNLVSVAQTDLVVYATFDGDRYTKIVDREVDFFKYPPTESEPFKLELGVDKIDIIDSAQYARLQNKIKSVEDATAGASVRFQIKNANVQQVQQITQVKKNKLATFNLGPAKVHVGEAPKIETHENEIFLTPVTQDKIKYTIFNKDSSKKTKSGSMKIGDLVPTGWMGLELRLLDYLPHALEEYEVSKLDRPTPMTTAAIKIRHKELEKWVALNDVIKLFGVNNAYLLSYQNRRLDTGFELNLKNFEVQRYQGTMKAMQYASHVEANASGKNVSAVISMNEPLKFNGYTIYQASFQEDEQTGEPVASIFSVNRDPGRAIKYLGSLVLSIGTVWLFYQRRKRATAA